MKFDACPCKKVKNDKVTTAHKFGAIRQIAPFFYIFRRRARAIIVNEMEVYVELALLENFCMDWVLLFCAAKVTKNICSKLRITVAAVLGACFAVAFPLLNLSGAAAITVKLLSGAVITLIGGKYNKPIGYVKFTFAFLAFTFALGGLLIAVFNLAGWSYSANSGYILSSVPIGIPFFAGLILIIYAEKIAARLTSKYGKNSVRLRIYAGQSCAEMKGFYDSGNRVTYLGEPVSIISESVARGLVDISRIKTFVNIHTVAESKKMAVFRADKIVIDDGESKREIKSAIIGISPKPVRLAVLHPDLSEDN